MKMMRYYRRMMKTGVNLDSTRETVSSLEKEKKSFCTFSKIAPKESLNLLRCLRKMQRKRSTNGKIWSIAKTISNKLFVLYSPET